MSILLDWMRGVYVRAAIMVWRRVCGTEDMRGLCRVCIQVSVMGDLCF